MNYEVITNSIEKTNKLVSKRILVALVVISFLASCSRSVTPGEAANHHYGHCRDVR